MEDKLPQSRHFSLQQLAEGVYAAVHREGGWATANAGIVDLGDQTLVFDTFMSPAAAQDLCEAAEQLTHRPVAYVINSHYHNDHIWGNQVFETADIIATERTRQLIQTRGQEEFDWYRDSGPERLKELQEQYEAAGDESQRERTRFWLTYYQAIADTMPQLEVWLPNLTFAERLSLHGSSRRVEVIGGDGGHTPNDAMLYLPEEGILFMADLLFVKCHPYLADGDPQASLRILDQVAALPLKVVVPGHGPVGTPADLRLMKQYIIQLQAMAAEMVRNGQDVAEAAGAGIPDAFADWQLGVFFEANLRFLLAFDQAQGGGIG